MCLLCILLPAQKNTESRGSAQFMVFAKVGLGGMQWGEGQQRGQQQQHLHPRAASLLLLIWL